MKHWPPVRPRKPRRPYIPAFHPVPVGARHDGWTVERQAEFIGMLAQTGSVLAAARAVSMSREGAYKLRRRPGAAGFAAAWDVALCREEDMLAHPRVKFTDLPLAYRLEAGLVQVILYRGRYCGFSRKADSSGLIGHLARIARARRGGGFGGERSQIFTPVFASTCGPSLRR